MNFVKIQQWAIAEIAKSYEGKKCENCHVEDEEVYIADGKKWFTFIFTPYMCVRIPYNMGYIKETIGNPHNCNNFFENEYLGYNLVNTNTYQKVKSKNILVLTDNDNRKYYLDTAYINRIGKVSEFEYKTTDTNRPIFIMYQGECIAVIMPVSPKTVEDGIERFPRPPNKIIVGMYEYNYNLEVYKWKM